MRRFFLAMISILVISINVTTSNGRALSSTPAPKSVGTDISLRPTMSEAELCETIVSAARTNQLPIGFFTNLIWQESGFNSNAVSRAGAQGIAQFMPQVAEQMGVTDPFDPRQALPAAARLLRSLYGKFGNLGLAAAAYNAGPGRIVDWLANRGKMPIETRNYVLTITGRAVEKWHDVKSALVLFQVPASVPCHRVQSFEMAENVERAQAMTMIKDVGTASQTRRRNARG
jgi:Transglycosylase SLT domain